MRIGIIEIRAMFRNLNGKQMNFTKIIFANITQNATIVLLISGELVPKRLSQ